MTMVSYDKRLKLLALTRALTVAFGDSLTGFEISALSCEPDEGHVIAANVSFSSGSLPIVLKLPRISRNESTTATNLERERCSLTIGSSASLPSPRILAHGTSDEWLLMTRLHGVPLHCVSDACSRRNIIAGIARTLALVHTVHFSCDSGPSALPLISTRQRIESILDNTRALDHPDSSVIRDSLTVLVPPKDRQYVLVHGDLSASNVIVEDRGSCGFVDWERSHFGPREEDLAVAVSAAAGICRPGTEQTWFLTDYQRLTGYTLNRAFTTYRAIDLFEQAVNNLSVRRDHRRELQSALEFKASLNKRTNHQR
jgi:aminoglycoside phosphotransferase (APT) family kinase protein